jgi:hypothetical protein
VCSCVVPLGSRRRGSWLPYICISSCHSSFLLVWWFRPFLHNRYRVIGRTDPCLFVATQLDWSEVISGFLVFSTSFSLAMRAQANLCSLKGIPYPTVHCGLVHRRIHDIISLMYSVMSVHTLLWTIADCSPFASYYRSKGPCQGTQ